MFVSIPIRFKMSMINIVHLCPHRATLWLNKNSSDALRAYAVSQIKTRCLIKYAYNYRYTVRVYANINKLFYK